MNKPIKENTDIDMDVWGLQNLRAAYEMKSLSEKKHT